MVCTRAVASLLPAAPCLSPRTAYAADRPPPTGQGAGPRSGYLELVDGNRQNPPDAPDFHGYVSWAAACVSARADAAAALREQETPEPVLIECCREHPRHSFTSALEARLPVPLTC